MHSEYLTAWLGQPGNLFDSKREVSSCVEYALSKALEYKPSVPSIIVTDFKDIAVFRPPARNRPEPAFEKILTTQPPLALRAISTAYLEDALPRDYINTPDPHMEADEDLIKGPPQDPSRPLLADKQIFATYHRHSDFDLVTLIKDRARALQFFRWKSEVRRRYSKVVAHPNDTLIALTNEVGFIVPDVQPLYPFDTSEIPLDTATHLTSIQRESPLKMAGLDESLEQSKSFTIRIQSVLAEGSPRGICTVYRCQILSIDNELVLSPSVCLKLFDDRFQDLRSPEEDDEQLDETLPRWFDPVVFAEMYALNEAFAYEKLRPGQGSIIPWFYGIHQVTNVIFDLLPRVLLTVFHSLLFPMEWCSTVF